VPSSSGPIADHCEHADSFVVNYNVSAEFDRKKCKYRVITQSKKSHLRGNNKNKQTNKHPTTTTTTTTTTTATTTTTTTNKNNNNNNNNNQQKQQQQQLWSIRMPL
jgi:hypothetical protein